MTLIKTSLLSGVAVVIKMLTLLGLNKVLAIYVGPTGYAALGQFQNSVQMITTLASGALNTGVTKYTAEYHADEERQRLVWRTAGTVAMAGSLLIASLVIFFNRLLADWFLDDEGLGSVFVWLAATLVLLVFNTLLLAILNGKKEIKRYVASNIAGSLFALVITTAMSIQLGLYGALVALAIYQSLAFFTTFWLCRKAAWFKLSYLFGSIDMQVTKDLAKFAAMALTSAACVPLSHILVRNHLGETIGWEAAGYWEAMWRLSAAYLMLVTTTLSVYYLPRLSELENLDEIKKEIINGYKVILPTVSLCGFLIFLLRDVVIDLLFTSEFSAMNVLFAWQMVGDVLKIGSWVLAYLMLGKAMMKLFIASELLFSLLFYVLVVILTDLLGLVGVVVAHSINYFFYWLVLAYFMFKFLRKPQVTV